MIDARRLDGTGNSHRSQIGACAPSIGELKARHREDHLCLRCAHQGVCGTAKSLDPSLLITIANCLAFDPDDAEDPHRVCELTPIEPLALP